MKLLIINAGSSTIKFNLFQANAVDDIASLARGNVSKINKEKSLYSFYFGAEKSSGQIAECDHKKAIDFIVDYLQKNGIKLLSDIDAIGYRVVHGGDYLEVQNAFETKNQVFNIAKKFTKAHADGLIQVVNYLTEIAPNVRQYFDFDTLYHIRTMKPEYYIYALPQDKCRALGIRKFGEHGLSHQYIAEHSKSIFGDGQVVISCHLGSGSSISCIDDGVCVDNSMGLTPLAGVVMGTRCGNIDPSTITYMMNEYNYSPDEMDEIMNLHSGLKGLCGESDMQRVIERMNCGDEQAKLAYRVVINSYIKSIGGKILQVGDKIKGDLSNLKIVFTAGIGENSNLVRADVIEKFRFMGLELDEELNNKQHHGDQKISSAKSKAEIWILPTNEELVVAEDVLNKIKNDHEKIT